MDNKINELTEIVNSKGIQPYISSENKDPNSLVKSTTNIERALIVIFENVKILGFKKRDNR